MFSNHSLRSLFAVLILAVSLNAAASSPPNIVFIMVDDLGIKDLHCDGREDHRTPHLDQLATDGMRFTSAYCAQPVCSPSRAAILFGKFPARLHLTTYLRGFPDLPGHPLLQPSVRREVGLGEKSLARYFKEAGYVTAAIGKWHVGGEGFGPIEHGFDFVHSTSPNTTPSATEGGKGEYDLTRAAEKFITENRARPFVLYLAHNSPHIPYKAAAERVASQKNAFEPVYAAVVETIDDTVGLILGRLDALGLRENTIVVFTSDNGGVHVPEAGHPRITYNSPYRAGKGYLYEGGLRVPLIVRWPGHVPAGAVVDAAVVNTGWIPTLLSLAGLPAPTGLDGVSFAGLLTGKGPAPEGPLFWHFPHYTNQGGSPGGAMRDGDWKFVLHYDAPEAPELYRLSTDIGERHNLAADEPARVERMRTALTAWCKSIGTQPVSPNPAFDPVKARELHSDIDISGFEPDRASASEWQAVARWRKALNVAARNASTPGH